MLPRFSQIVNRLYAFIYETNRSKSGLALPSIVALGPYRLWGLLRQPGKGTRKPNLGGRRAGRLHTRQETRNLGLKAITDKSGPVLIRFEVDDRETLMPLGDHAAHWANYLGELVRELPLHYPSWRQMPPERKARVVAKIGRLQKIYNGKKAALKQRYWVPEEDRSYDLEGIRRACPSHISEADWDA
nr:hypothetical protein [Tanacetum cinerariifolium]